MDDELHEVAVVRGLDDGDQDPVARNVERVAATTAVLGGELNIDAFLGSALLVNTYYALGGQRDKDGKIVLANRKALSAQLDLARRFAREAAARAQASAGFIPVAAHLSYQLAGAIRKGDDDDKLAALQACWQSAQWSELAARLAAP